MNFKLPIAEAPPASPPKDTEVEYALILSQMIEVAEENPSQLRLAIYEFARTKLINNTLNATEVEKERLSKSLEAAIAGVERFAELRGKNRKRIVFRHGGAELSDYSGADGTEPPLSKGHFAAAQIQARTRHSPMHRLANTSRVLAQELQRLGGRFNWFAVCLLSFVAIIMLVVMTQGSSLWRSDKKALATSAAIPAADPTAAAVPMTKKSTGTPASQSDSPLPLPDNYGIYLLNGSSLVELEAIETRVPDRRIEMSTPVSVVHQTTIATGAPRFLLYRRDLMNDPLDKVEVRPLARVGRVVSFDPKGKPLFSSAPSMWIIRNIAFDFRVRPVPGHPEMLMVQAKDGAAELPSGRYVLAIKDKGFDFVVAGEVTDPTQCVERTDAVNGSFYSDCQQR